MLKKLNIKNFKTIEDLEIDFEGGVYLITGDNELGKSTLINAIFTLLTGDRSDNLLTNGKDSGQISGSFEQDGKEYLIELRYTKRNQRGKLTITEKGSPFSTDKKGVLESIFGYNDFDVSEFIEWSKTKPGRRKQVAFIKTLLPAEVQKQVTVIDHEIEKIIPSKKETENKLKTQDAICNNHNVDTDFILKYSEPLPVDDVKEKIKNASTRNQSIEDVRTKNNNRKLLLSKWGEHEKLALSQFNKDIDASDALIEKLEKELKEAKSKRDEINAAKALEIESLAKDKAKEQEALEEHNQWLLDNQEDDIDSLNKELEGVIVHNTNVEKLKKFKEDKKQLDNLTTELSKHREDIKKLKGQRKTLVDANPLPMPGLTFDLERLYLNDVPFEEDEVSTSQIMETSVRLMIAKNPSCKMFRIGRGESLGAEKFKAIIDFAKKMDYQGFIEEVVRGQKQLNVFEYTENDK